MTFCCQGTFLTVILVAILCGESGENETRVDQELTILHLLTLLPSSDVADSLLPAAELAVDKINAKDDLLPGYTLELITADTELCNETLITESYISFVKYVASDCPSNVVGVIGMTCATVTQAISPLAGRPDIDLLQISAGELPPTFTNVQAYPRLYRVISSSAVQNDALLALMDAFEWRRISIISDSSLIDHTGTAGDFIKKVNQNSSLHLNSQKVVTPRSVGDIDYTSAMKIIYVSTTAEEAWELLCTAYHQGRRWPTYVWILRNLRVEELKIFPCKNDSVEVMAVLENVFFITFKLEANHSENFCGETHEECRQDYQNLLGNTTMDVALHDSVWAFALHDSVCAFALALNKSLDELTSQDLETYGLGKSNVTTIIENNLKTVNFIGALGCISFTDEREAETTVEILQVRNGNAVEIGYYDPHSRNFTLKWSPEHIPNDSFQKVRRKLHEAAPIVTLTATGILLVSNTVFLFLYIYQWNKPTIKATSPKVGLLILIGCYALIGGAMVLGLREYINNFGAMCQAEFWLQALGFQLIYGTMFIRLLRVYRIFAHTFKLPGKLWFDRTLIFVVLLTVVGIALLHLLWTTVDPLQTLAIEVDFNPPYNVVGEVLLCDTKDPSTFFVWYGLHLGYVWITVLLVVIFSALTRKVTIKNFKDTTEVNMFVYISFFTLALCFLFAVAFARIHEVTGDLTYLHISFTFEVLTYIIAPLFCQLILFAPKLWKVRSEKNTFLPYKRFGKHSITTQISKISSGVLAFTLRHKP